MLVQLAYAIGVAEPVSIFVNSYGTAKAGLSDSEIAEGIARLFDLRPAAITRKFQLLNPIYEDTAAYGHFGKKPFTRKVKLMRDPGDGLGRREVEREIQFYGWEKLDSVDLIREAFAL
jgi:S-adenosylmethionine synthetase